MWDLPRPGLEPVSPALAGRFSTTVPPGKPQGFLLVTDHELRESQAVCSAWEELPIFSSTSLPPKCPHHLSEINILQYLKHILAYGSGLFDQGIDGHNPENHTGCVEASKHLKIIETKVNAGPFLNLILTHEPQSIQLGHLQWKRPAPTPKAGHPASESADRGTSYQAAGGGERGDCFSCAGKFYVTYLYTLHVLCWRKSLPGLLQLALNRPPRFSNHPLEHRSGVIL